MHPQYGADAPTRHKPAHARYYSDSNRRQRRSSHTTQPGATDKRGTRPSIEQNTQRGNQAAECFCLGDIGIEPKIEKFAGMALRARRIGHYRACDPPRPQFAQRCDTIQASHHYIEYNHIWRKNCRSRQSLGSARHRTDCKKAGITKRKFGSGPYRIRIINNKNVRHGVLLPARLLSVEHCSMYVSL